VPAHPQRHHPWEPPEAEFPGIVPVDTLLLGRTDQVAVAVTGLSAFSAGIEIFVNARIRPSVGHPEEHLPGRQGTSICAVGLPRPSWCPRLGRLTGRNITDNTEFRCMPCPAFALARSLFASPWRRKGRNA
jgi:hypothetical protein